MFERFTDKGRVVLVRAQEIARELKSPGLRRHHLLVALIDGANDNPDDNLAAVLNEAGIDLAATRVKVLASLQATETAGAEPAMKLKFSSGAKKALELSLREAMSLGHNYIASSHLLLGVLRSADGPLADVIAATGLDYATAREFVRTSPPEATGRRGRGRRGREGRIPRRGRGTEGFEAVIRRAHKRALMERPTTTGDLLVALAEMPDTHFASILSGVALPDPTAIGLEADRLIGAGTRDGSGNAITVDESGRVTIEDEFLAQVTREGIGAGLSQSDLVKLIREALRDKE
jgi:ATP-dependent Clp protease ATP-binding subunit ClpC